MPSANKGRINSFLMIFYFPHCTKTSNTMMSRGKNNGYPCLVYDLRVKAFRFLLLNMMFAVACLFVFR